MFFRIRVVQDRSRSHTSSPHQEPPPPQLEQPQMESPQLAIQLEPRLLEPTGDTGGHRGYPGTIPGGFGGQRPPQRSRTARKIPRQSREIQGHQKNIQRQSGTIQDNPVINYSKVGFRLDETLLFHPEMSTPSLFLRTNPCGQG